MIIINKIRLAEIRKKLFNDMALLQKIMSCVSHNCGNFNTECIWEKNYYSSSFIIIEIIKSDYLSIITF